jgi:HAE1 family hydrophobic/amphiphilic exporter-1
VLSMARLATNRPIAVSVCALVIVIIGMISWRDLPLDLFPDLQSPTVLVSISSGDRPAIEMERQYGERIEQLLFTVRGISAINQVARTGRIITRITFNWETDVDLAIVEVNRAVASIAANNDVDEVIVRRFDPRQLPVLVMGLTLEEGLSDLAELRRIAKRQLAPSLEQLDGVAEVHVTGGRIKEVQVLVDPTRLKAYDLTITDVQNRIRESNVDINAGTLSDGERVLLVRGLSRFIEADDIANVVVRFINNEFKASSAVKVSDIANVVVTDADIHNLVRINGSEGVGLSIYKEAGANTVTVSRTVRAALENLSENLPHIKAITISDEALLVEDAISDVESAALVGITLAIAVLFFYLRSPGPIIVVAVAVPVSLLASVFAMRFAGHSLNLMTLGGLALGAGMLVDNAIVVIESIFRRRELGDSPTTAAAKGTAFVGGAIVASTLTTCIVFLPVLFVDGLASKLVSGISFTVVFSLLASLLVAIFLIPALSVWLLPKKHIKNFDPGGVKVENFVYRLMERPKTVVFVTTILSGLALIWLLRLGTELLPPSDPRQFSMRVLAPAGQSVESTSAMVANIESIVATTAGNDLKAIMAEVGRLDDDDRHIREQQTEENTGELFVRLAAGGLSPTQIVEAAAPIVDKLYGAEVSWQVGNSSLAQALGTSGPPVVVKITGKSLDDLRSSADKIQQKLEKSPALWNVRSSFEGGPPEMLLTLKRSVADGLGVDMQNLGAVVEAALEGLDVTTLTMGDEQRNVVIKLPEVAAGELLALSFQASNGRLLTLGDVVQLKEVPGAKEIYRSDQQRAARVTALIKPEYNMPEVRKIVQQALAELNLPPGLSAAMAGEEIERQHTVNELQWAALLALLLVLMVIAGSFESLLHPFTILSAIPISLIGVAIALGIVGQPIGVMAMLGIIMLMGLAVNDAILLSHTARLLIASGVEKRKALARAAALRLRPITMTTATTVLALLPLAIGGGEAAELRSPLALTVVGGIIASTIGSLLVIPCIYLLLDRGDNYEKTELVIANAA